MIRPTTLLVLASGIFSIAGCQIVLGLAGDTDLPAEAGLDAAIDASSDQSLRSDVDASAPPGAAVQVSSSTLGPYWCAVTLSGDVECWGNNESGELGNGTTQGTRTPVKVTGLPGPVEAVSLGTVTGCAVTKSGAAYCWGFGSDGELGNGTTDAFSMTAVPVSGLDLGVTAIATGYGVNCAVKDGAVFCWGASFSELLGTPQTDNALAPIAVPALASGVTSVSVGGSSACAVKNGGVLCWGGYATSGQLGNNTTDGSATPVSVVGLTHGVVAVSVGVDFACALTEGRAVLCWGDGTRGALGDGQFAVSPVPVPVAGLTSGVMAVSAGSDSTSAILADGTVVCWGSAADGELGNGSSEQDGGIGFGIGGVSGVPVRVKTLPGPAVSVSTGEAPCAALKSGAVECWGPIGEDALTPVPVTDEGPVISLTTGGDLSTDEFACAVSADASIGCWGGNGAGQLGNGTTTSGSIPVQNAALKIDATVVSGSPAGNFACAVASGLAYCWGDNSYGELGDGTKSGSSIAVAVEELSGVVSVAAGSDFACAITSAGPDAGLDAGEGGSLYCWGDNSYGQLGNGSSTSTSVPVAIPDLTSGVAAVAAGTFFVCALLSDGTVDCWGYNGNGQLGNGSTKWSSVPTKVSGLTGATAIGAGWFSACAVTSGGVSCWGDNSLGELGNGTTTPSQVPVDVFGLPVGGATEVAVGRTTACAVAAGGAFCWGTPPIGNGSSPMKFFTSAVPVTGLGSGVTAVAVGDLAACAAVVDGVRCWGLNTAGELGNGGAVDAFLPTAIPGFP
jgi:alpha-tubulin suppressor-like RCC1 family protein